MRTMLIVLGATLAILAFGSDMASAQDYAWCAWYTDGGGRNCGFTSQRQCLASVSGVGGVCVPNPRYGR